MPLSHSSAIGIPVFQEHVPDVFFLRAREQVPGIDAASNVALMADQDTIRELSVMQQVRDPVRFEHLFAKSKLPVAIARAGRPKPTGARGPHGDLLPEPLLKPLHLFACQVHDCFSLLPLKKAGSRAKNENTAAPEPR